MESIKTYTVSTLTSYEEAALIDPFGKTKDTAPTGRSTFSSKEAKENFTHFKTLVFHLNSTIGIKIDENGEVRIAVAFCHINDEFDRKLGQIKVTNILEKGSDSNLVFRGTYSGDLKQTKNNIITPFFKAFKSLLLTSCQPSDISDWDHKTVHMHKDRLIVVATRRTLLLMTKMIEGLEVAEDFAPCLRSFNHKKLMGFSMEDLENLSARHRVTYKALMELKDQSPDNNDNKDTEKVPEHNPLESLN